MDSPPPPGDDNLQIVPRDKAIPRLLQTAAGEDSQPDPDLSATREEQAPTRRGHLSFVGSILLIAVAFSVGLSYLLEKRWLHPPAAAAAAESESGGGLLKPAMFHVTAVSLGASRLAIVNGKPVEEGGTVIVSTSAGAAQVRVTRIEDGVVRFIYGNEQIAVRTDSGAVSPNPP